MDSFCGGEAFWNTSITWSDDILYPDFTECFQNSALIWISSCVILLSLPVYLPYLLCQPHHPLPVGWKNISKLCIGVLQLVIVVVEIFYGASDLSKRQATFWQAYFIGPVTEATTLIIVFVYLELERRKGFVTSGVLFFYWLLACLTYIIPFYRKLIMKEYDTFVLGFTLFNVYYGLTLFQLILACIAETDPNQQQKNPWPETGACFLSRISFHWVYSLVRQGFKKTLTEEDMYCLSPKDMSTVNIDRFEAVWRKQEVRLHQLARQRKCVYIQEDGRQEQAQDREELPFSETTPLLSAQPSHSCVNDTSCDKSHDKSHDQHNGLQSLEEHDGKVSLLGVLWRTFWLELIASQMFKLIYDILVFVNPFLLRLMIDFASDDEKPSWQGYVLSGAFLCVIVTQSFSFHACMYQTFGVALRMRSVLVAAIFKKAMRMNNRTRTESTTGEIVNFMSVDVEIIKDFVTYCSFVWSGPVQIVGSLVFLYYTVGYAMFAGLAVLVVLVPLNALVSSKVQSLQETMMAQKDQRIKLMTEILNGIKVLKLSAWEMAFGEKVTEIRERELKLLLKEAIINAAFSFSWTVSPFMIGLATYATYIYTQKDHRIDAQTAFVAMALFNILKFAIIMGPYVVMSLVKAYVSVKRLNKFLNAPDLDETNVQHVTDIQDAAIKIEDGTFTWNPEMGPCLSDININVPVGSLVAVVGSVGSGKTSIISSILGEMEKIKGQVYVKGTTAYVPQQAWIQNCSLQDNVLFGNQLDQPRYQAVIEACALTSDLDLLPAKDKTEIGEKGINLSGGQRQRVSLARAIYFDCDTYLLDDPLSAVDSHVGKHIFDHVIGGQGLLAKKTRILVTHGIQWLPKVDFIIVLTNGRISEVGSYSELLEHEGAFANFLRTYLTSKEDEEEEEDDEVRALKTATLERLMSRESDGTLSEDDPPHSPLKKDKKPRSRTVSHSVSEKLETIPEQKPTNQASALRDSAKLIDEEELESGSVGWSVVGAYFRAVGYPYVVLLFTLYALFEALVVYSNIWLTNWTSDRELQNLTALPADSQERRAKNNLYLGVYGALGAGQAIFIVLFLVTQGIRLLHAARSLHHAMLINILRAPMAFFDTTPVGRILNRFSQDVESIDSNIPHSLEQFLDCLFVVFSILVIISYSTPIFMVVIIPVSIVYALVQRYYIPTSRQLRRLESKTRSPIFNNFSESLTGVTVIRAFNVQDRFIDQSKDRVDTNQVYGFSSVSANRWLGLRLEVLGACIVFTAAVFSVLERDKISGAIAGLSISYALQITDNLNWLVRMLSETETNIVSVERVQQYTKVKQESPLHQEHRPNADWPEAGSVEFNNFSLRYRDNLDLVLKDISFKIRPQEKVGIVGRTGAGKSSLTVALFRLIEGAAGNIVIDSENINQLGLHDLRSCLTILPQEPVLFSGSLRLNLDPLDAYTDSEVWGALDHAHLRNFVDSLPGQLTYDVGEGGQNLSIGQRQLMCLARSLLRKTKILILDEATAAVDLETDQLIQGTISQEFADCTVITIAHRINTVLDYDRILVLTEGRIKEFDTPTSLLADQSSTFYSMAKDAGLV